MTDTRCVHEYERQTQHWRRRWRRRRHKRRWRRQLRNQPFPFSVPTFTGIGFASNWPTHKARPLLSFCLENVDCMICCFYIIISVMVFFFSARSLPPLFRRPRQDSIAALTHKNSMRKKSIANDNNTITKCTSGGMCVATLRLLKEPLHFLLNFPLWFWCWCCCCWRWHQCAPHSSKPSHHLAGIHFASSFSRFFVLLPPAIIRPFCPEFIH